MSKRMSPNIRRMSAWSTMVTHSYVEKLVLPHEQLHPAIVELLPAALAQVMNRQISLSLS